MRLLCRRWAIVATRVLIALGSNRRHGVHGRPEAVIAAAVAALTAAGLRVVAVSRTRPTAPVGPGGRRFANAAAAVETRLSLPRVLAIIKQVERDFGRRGGRRWGDRVLDLDIIGAGDAVVRQGALIVPHPRLSERRFVMDPLVDIAPRWRHPLSHLTARQLRARAMRPKARIHVVRRKGP
jgi:2-amino-4-hydroxy-6-hydroxymethyldihydropteridine diphosphokinase